MRGLRQASLIKPRFRCRCVNTSSEPFNERYGYSLENMCVNSITIKNKGYHHLGGMPFVDVPCRKCEECSNAAQIDYFVRAWAMYKYLPQNWQAWFVTLTFNEDNIPWSDVLATMHSELTGSHLVKIGRVRCFDHSILQRFIKSYRQYFRRLGLPTPHLLVTCEFGDKYHRPHYHAIIFVPRFYTWSSFKRELERFWHYGFTKNVALKSQDGQTQERDVVNCFKYVLKYVLKGSSVMPYYFNHGDRVFLKDVEPCKYTPRVFTTNGFGKALESVLVHQSYVDNKITFDVGGKYKTFNLPNYFRRRYFTRSVVDSKEAYTKKTFWKECRAYRVRQHTEYRHDYAHYRDLNIQKRLRIEYFQIKKALPSTPICESDWVKYRSLDYNMHKVLRYIRASRWLNANLFESDGVNLDDVFSEKSCLLSRFYVTLSPKLEDLSNEVRESDFCRHSTFNRYLRQKYGWSIDTWLYRMESCRSDLRDSEISQRKESIVGRRAEELNFYEQHRIQKDVS